jgi:hypothetical protein
MSATQKIQYKPATTEHDYALARYDVLLDGTKIGQVIQYETETSRQMTSGIRYDVRPARRWAFQAPGRRCYMQYTSRKAAAMALAR